VLTVVAFIAAALLYRLAEQQRSGPSHEDLSVGDGIPVTFYVPTEANDVTEIFPDPPPVGQRFPTVILAHGFSADRAVMSSLARSLAVAGYAVLAFDFRGHGTNRNGFRSGELGADLDQVIGWASRSPYIDVQRIALMGHSMGGTVALNFAAGDRRPAAVIVLSSAQRLADGVDIGSEFVDGPRRPPNVLFLWTAGDPSFIGAESRHLASRLVAQPVEVGRTYGDFATSTAVRAQELVRLNHGTVLWSDQTVAAAVDWLDQSFGVARPTPSRMVDPRLATAELYLGCVLVLTVGLGFVAAKASESSVPFDAVAGWHGLGFIALSLLVAGAFSGPVSAAGFLSLSVFDSIVAFWGVAGAVLLTCVSLARRRRGSGFRLLPASWRGVRDALVIPAAVVVVGVYVLLVPLGVVAHNLVPTPRRLADTLVCFSILAPFFVCFQLLARQGRPATAALRSLAGDLVLLAGVVVVSDFGGLPGVVDLLIPIFVIVFVIVELAAASFHREGGGGAAIGLIEAALLAWIVSVMGPVG